MADKWRQWLLQERVREDSLTLAMRELCGRIHSVDSRFAEETDGDLLDAYMYERLALQARYRYLTRQARLMEERV